MKTTSKKITALVTGSSSGLGWQITKKLIDKGYFVVGISRTQNKECSSRTENFIQVEGDICSTDTIEMALSYVNIHGKFKLLVNCAGVGFFENPGEGDMESISRCIATNLTGTVLVTDSAFSELNKNHGTVVNIASTAALKPIASEAIYCASKWGVKGYTDSLREYCKTKKLTVIGVYPGGMRTKFWQDTNYGIDKRYRFMEAEHVAERVLDVLSTEQKTTVTDIVICAK